MNSKRKGNRGEREASELWRAAGFAESRRRLTREEAREGDGRDLEGTGRWAVQVKYGARPNPLAALSEIRERVPVVMLRKVNRSERAQPWAVCLWWSDFEELLKRCAQDPPS